VLAELASERRWDELFAGSTDVLSELAEEALAEHRAGRTQPLDTDTLRSHALPHGFEAPLGPGIRYHTPRPPCIPALQAKPASPNAAL
jgi:hypothetical protein